MNAIFALTLLVNLITLVIPLAAAIERPILSYQLIAVTALCATLLALDQVITDRGNPFALSFTASLVVIMMWRIVRNRRGGRRHRANEKQ